MSRSRRTSRSGFTLIEILVTIGVIALLASVLIVATKGVVGVAKASATKATIRKVDSLLTKRMEAFNRAIIEQDQQAKSSGKAPLYVQSAQQQPLYASNPTLAAVLSRKITFRNNFPQLFSEITGFSGSPPKHVAETESAEALYHLITNMPAFGTEAPDSDSFGNSEIADTDGDGLKEFVDGWGRPLRFYRWPTRLIRPVLASGSENEAQTVDGATMTAPHDDWLYHHPININYDASSGASANVLLGGLSAAPGVTRGTGATFGNEHADPLARDPDDPLGLLHPANYATASTAASQFERSYHTLDTYHTALIVSAGQDGLLGLLEPNDVSKYGNLAQPKLTGLSEMLDNITNRNLRAGGE